MKKLISIVFVLLAFNAFANEAETKSEKYSTYGLDHLRGDVTWGPFLNCELMNHSDDDLKVVHYYYDIRFTDQFGRMRRNVERVMCTYNCDIDAFSFSIFTGPKNYPNIYDARCGAYVRYDHY